VPEEELARELRTLPGSRTALRVAARVSTRGTDWPAARVRAVLIAAAAGAPVVPATLDDLAAYLEQRELLDLPPEEAFELLAVRLPVLRDLLSQAKKTMPPLTLPVPGDPATGSESPSFVAFQELRRNAGSLVGPTSGQSDRLLASNAAMRVVSHLLLTAGGIARPKE
jgi:hypothetical protein